MFGLLLILGSAVWIALAIGAGKLTFALSRRRWLQFLAVLAILWLPLWDVIPGWIKFHQAVQQYGGVRIHRTVSTDGYLDSSQQDCQDCWTSLKYSNFKYVEIEVTVPRNLRALPGWPDAEPGFYQFALSSAGSPSCASLQGLPGEAFVRRETPVGRCLVAIRHDKPVSRYEYQMTRMHLTSKALPPVEVFCLRVLDRAMSENVAEACQIYYKSWLGTAITIPQWNYDRTENGNPIRFNVLDVIKPTS
jgi:hypothetical protein